jgi:hypothetical protein
MGLNPCKWSTLDLGIPDEWMVKYGLNPLSSTEKYRDKTGGGLTNYQKYLLGGDPTKLDTSGNGYSDYIKAIIIPACDLSDPKSVPNKLPPDIDINDFIDLVGGKNTSNSWWYDEVVRLITGGIINGYNEVNSKYSFRAENQVTRAEFAKLLAEISGEKITDFKSVFPDTAGHWSESAVAWAASKNIIKGRDSLWFDPEALITREEIAMMLGRFIDYKKGTYVDKDTAVTFKDVGTIQDQAKDYITKMQKAGIIKGYEDGTFGPKLNTKRNEAAVMMHRMGKMLNMINDIIPVVQ